jgi:hypothetical protein
LGNNTVTTTQVAVTQNTNQQKTSYLVESFFTYNHFLGRAKNISYEKDGNFTVVSERYFATITEGELVGPVRTYSGFTLAENGQLAEIDCDKSQIEFERCGAVIDNAYSYQPPETYSLTKQGAVNADVHNCGNGINVQDAVAIQKSVLKLIDSLPVK